MAAERIKTKFLQTVQKSGKSYALEVVTHTSTWKRIDGMPAKPVTDSWVGLVQKDMSDPHPKCSRIALRYVLTGSYQVYG